jgi:hypothetical protein
LARNVWLRDASIVGKSADLAWSVSASEIDSSRSAIFTSLFCSAAIRIPCGRVRTSAAQIHGAVISKSKSNVMILNIPEWNPALFFFFIA